LKHKVLFGVCFVVLVMLAMRQSAYAESSQVSTTVELNFLTIHLSYPSEVLPGQAATVSVQGTAKDYVQLGKLVLQIYYADGNSLHLLTAVTVANNVYLSKGNQVSRDIQVNVPADAPRTSLVALVTENVNSPSYNYWSYYYPYSYWFWGDENYTDTYFLYAYPTYYYTSVTDDGLSPLSYIKATTPEYVTLQGEYQMVQQQLNQSRTDNQKLQDTVAQNNSVIANLNEQLASTQAMVRTLEAFAIILAVIAIVLGLLLFKGKIRRPKKSSSNKQ
jgi:hypothetical protein